MSQGLWIFIIVILSFFALFLIIDTVIFIYVLRLKKSIKKRSITINSLMAQQYDLVTLLGKKMLDLGIELPENLLVSLDLHEKKEMNKLSTSERIKMKTLITDCGGALLLLLNTSSDVDLKSLNSIVNSMDEFNHRYRQETILYNQDIYAYNYWVHFWTFYLVALVFNLRKREPIQ